MQCALKTSVFTTQCCKVGFFAINTMQTRVDKIYRIWEVGLHMQLCEDCCPYCGNCYFLIQCVFVKLHNSSMSCFYKAVSWPSMLFVGDCPTHQSYTMNQRKCLSGVSQTHCWLGSVSICSAQATLTVE